MSIREQIAQRHYQPLSTLMNLLAPLEWGYRLGVWLRLQVYRLGLLRPLCASVPVISVGNLTTGGTGKTPVVLELARGLASAGKKVVILSRGYGAHKPLAYGRADRPEHGEEAFYLQQQLPEAVVIVGKDRAKNARLAVEDYRPDFILLDDGYQYLRLQRDFNILLIDGEHLLGNRHLLPLGPLREPEREMVRADIVFITKLVTTEILSEVEGWLIRHGRRDVPVLPVGFQVLGLHSVKEKKRVAPNQLDALKRRPVVALSGIAQPDRFEADLKAQGFQIRQHTRFSDHHNYTAADVDSILAQLQTPADEPSPILVTTDKDWVKLKPLMPPAVTESLYTLKVRPMLDGEWFYREFLSQMFRQPERLDAHVPSSGSRR